MQPTPSRCPLEVKLHGFILEVYRLSVRNLVLMPEWIVALHLLDTGNRSQKVFLPPFGIGDW